jgi:hypothetical protein
MRFAPFAPARCAFAAGLVALACNTKPSGDTAASAAPKPSAAPRGHRA